MPLLHQLLGLVMALEVLLPHQHQEQRQVVEWQVVMGFEDWGWAGLLLSAGGCHGQKPGGLQMHMGVGSH